MNFKEKYTEALSDIRFSERFEEKTITKLVLAAEQKGENGMNKTMNRTTAALIIAIFIIALFSTGAFAISKLLSAGEVAEHFGEDRVAVSFIERDAEIETVTQKGYTVSFFGAVKGEKFGSDAIRADCSYYVVSVAAADGSPLSLTDGNPLGMSIIIEGYPAWQINSWSLNTSASGMQSNGILYYLYDCENLEIFADRNVYLAVYEGMTPGVDIISMNPDGTFAFSDGYSGFKAMFSIPLDPAKADPQAANEILKEYLSPEDTSSRQQTDTDLYADRPQDASETYTTQKDGIQSQTQTGHDTAIESEDDLIPASDMEPMANPKEKWAVSD